MSNYPESADVFTDKTGSDYVSSSDPNNSFDGIEAIQGLIGALGKPQSWSTTLMTLLKNYRTGLYLYTSSNSLLVGSGEAALVNTNSTKTLFRQNTSNVTLSAANIDVGAMAIATYYVYAIAPQAGTTSPIQFSTDAYAPSAIGTVCYKKLGEFQNAANGALAVTDFQNYSVLRDLISVVSGSCTHGDKITAPTGFSRAQCTFNLIPFGHDITSYTPGGQTEGVASNFGVTLGTDADADKWLITSQFCGDLSGGSYINCLSGYLIIAIK